MAILETTTLERNTTRNRTRDYFMERMERGIALKNVYRAYRQR